MLQPITAAERRSPSNSRIGLFSTVKAMLDGMVGSPPKNGHSWVELQRCLAHMSSEYWSGRPPSIPYHLPECRAAYVYANLAIHAAVIEQAILKYREIVFDPLWSRFSDKGSLRVCAFGGGPGTEALALMRLFQYHPPEHHSPELEITVIDRVSQWADACKYMSDAIKRHRTDHGVRLVPWFQSFDMTDLRYYGTAPTLRNQDLIILNYVVSELFAESDLLRLTNVMNVMADGASADTKLVIIDHKAAAEKVKNLMLLTGWAEVYCDEEQIMMPLEEDKSVLNSYLHKFVRLPRLQARTFKLVATKG